jgi:uncharacterized DUF497 family protein/uncharacterized protein (DUF4415 family)
MTLEWDPKKAASNLKKHGVRFADAYSVLEDPQALTIDDQHPDEQRHLTVGVDTLGRVLVVSYTWRGGSSADHLGSKGDSFRATTIREWPMSEYDFRGGKRGPVIEVPPGKTRITIRLDDDVLEWFREQADAAGGASYQTLINQALREYVVERAEPLEEKIRRMVREEVAKYAEGGTAKPGEAPL